MKVRDLITALSAAPADADVPTVEGPLDLEGALDLTTPNGTHFQLAISVETGSAAEAPES